MVDAKIVKQNINALENVIRLTFVRIISHNALIVKGRQFISMGCDFQISKYSKVILNPWVMIEKGSLVASRGGTLILGKIFRAC